MHSIHWTFVPCVKMSWLLKSDSFSLHRVYWNHDFDQHLNKDLIYNGWLKNKSVDNDYTLYLIVTSNFLNPAYCKLVVGANSEKLSTVWCWSLSAKRKKGLFPNRKKNKQWGNNFLTAHIYTFVIFNELVVPSFLSNHSIFSCQGHEYSHMTWPRTR